ncbi:MAG: hypothetical protein HY865_04990 [Chloroflexi bacterium]|nr:hypothetical protein [Chloroflexota bacterium]
MKTQTGVYRHILYRFASVFVLIFILFSCKPFTTATPETVAQPTVTPGPSLGIFQSRRLKPLDTPRTYIQDSCIYLINRWNRLNAAPGTVVMIVSFNDDLLYDFTQIMIQLHDQGFKAIDTPQFLTFMERNGRIPPRSVLIIQENNHSADEMRKFREYRDVWGWPVVNGWVSSPSTPDTMWRENVEMEMEGWVDHQSQGLIPGTVLSDDSSKTVISRELKGSMDAFAEHYAKNPLAIIWPGGGFGMRPVEAARQLGYQLGFTSNSRGPVMYNWVPLADEVDPDRPTYRPEGYIQDPLMTLPRYSQDQILEAIDKVRLTGNEAAEFARKNMVAEFEYYEAVCEPIYGPMPTP